jgi:nitroreductase
VGLDLTRPVPMSLVRECLEIALQAPSGSNRQSWHWVVVTDPDIRAGVGEVYRRAVEAYLATEGAAAKLFREDPTRAPVQRRVGESVAYLGDRMGQVPVLVIPCLRLPSPRLPDGGPPRRPLVNAGDDDFGSRNHPARATGRLMPYRRATSAAA